MQAGSGRVKSLLFGARRKNRTALRGGPIRRQPLLTDVPCGRTKPQQPIQTSDAAQATVGPNSSWNLTEGKYQRRECIVGEVVFVSELVGWLRFALPFVRLSISAKAGDICWRITQRGVFGFALSLRRRGRSSASLPGTAFRFSTASQRRSQKEYWASQFVGGFGGYAFKLCNSHSHAAGSWSGDRSRTNAPAMAVFASSLSSDRKLPSMWRKSIESKLPIAATAEAR